MLNRIQKEEVTTGLLQLGLSDKEAQTYLAVLENGDSTIPSLSSETGLSRGTVYDLVEKLKAKGFLNEIKKGKRRKIVAENATNKLYSVLDTKHAELQKSKKIVETILPTINAMSGNRDFKPQIRVYEGEKGFRHVWDEIFSYEGKNFLSIARIETFLQFVGQDFLDEIVHRKIKLGFTSRAINEDSPSARIMQSNDNRFARKTILAPKEFQFASTEIIFGDKIAMFSTREENIIVIIESKDFAETHRAYFEMLWKMLEK